jgi:septin family protein
MPNHRETMKTAYELAMERLNRETPSTRLTDGQKAEIAELESKYKAKLAEREIALKDLIAKAAGEGDRAKFDELEQQLANERRKLQAELEEKKENIRKGA